MMPSSLSPQIAEHTARSITELGSPTSPSEVRFVWREWRWLALLPRHVVFAAPDALAWQRLEREATVLAIFRRTAEVSVAHRCSDLRYLHSNGLRFARAALAAYAGEAGVAVAEETVGRFHVVSALEHFAFVSWDAPRFPHIIAWATAAVRALAPDWVA